MDRMIELLKQRADRYDEITAMLADPDVYSDNKRMAALSREQGALREQHSAYQTLSSLQSQIEGSREIVNDENADPEMKELAELELAELEATYEAELEKSQDLILLDDEDDSRDVILEIRGAEGGDEATLFARELMETYAHFCNAHNFKIETLDESESEVGGIKNATYRITGENVWKAFKYEGGGHRVQRVPSTEAQGRIHTSLATVAVLPEVEDVDIQINESDLEIKASRAGGPGGQKVNKTSSRCQIRHLPTGIMVDNQGTPSFHKNRDEAMRILKNKLYQMEKEKVDAERAGARAAMVGSGQRGDKIRTYNYPQDRCTDHRAKVNFPLGRIMEGRIDDLLDACREWEKQERLKALTKAAK